MKIAVVNFSGNVGKTTIAQHVLVPRLNEARLVTIERQMRRTTTGSSFRGEQFGELFVELILMDDAVIDVGASELFDFLEMMKQYQGSHEDIDLFVVPVVPMRKQQCDTIFTIENLVKIGVPRSKIRIVFMQCVRDVNDEFAHLLGAMAHHGIPVDLRAFIELTPLFDILETHGGSVDSVLADKTDYKAKMLSYPKGAPERDFCIDMRIAQGSAEEVNTNLQRVFNAICRPAHAVSN